MFAVKSEDEDKKSLFQFVSIPSGDLKQAEEFQVNIRGRGVKCWRNLSRFVKLVKVKG